MKNKERGAIIIEASIALPMFMFMIVTLLTIVNICFAQAKIGVAINTTAKEISQYSYLYGLTGLNQKQKAMKEKGSDSEKKIDEIIEASNTLLESANGLKDGAGSVLKNPRDIANAYQDISDSLESGKKAYQTMSSQLESIAEDPKEFIIGVGYMLGNGVVDEMKSRLIAAPLARTMVKKHLKSSVREEPEDFLRHLGIVPKGDSYLKGLDFTGSRLFPGGTDEIKIIVRYQVQVITLLNIDIKVNFTQCASTKAWFTGVSSAADKSGENGSGNSGDSTESESGSGDGTESESGSGDGTESESGSGNSTESESGSGDSTESESSGSSNNREEETETAETEEPVKSYEDYAREATKNGDSDKVILGKFSGPGGKDSYQNVAEYYDSTYFQMDNWDEVVKKVGADNMWNINEAFLRQQEEAGKTFYLAHDPDDPEVANSYYLKEIDWLRSRGYEFEFDAGAGLWRAVKK